MCAQFTDDDVGKSVVNANGEDVGVVTAVEHGTAHVEPDPGITDTIKATLGWGERDTDTYPLQEAAVAEVTRNEIRLQGDLSHVGSTGTDTDMDMGSDRQTEDDRTRRDDDEIV